MSTTATLRQPRHGPPMVRGHRIPSWVCKIVMAVTGAVWAVFLLVHLFGNLKVYLGQDAYDGYAHWLREVGYPLLPHGAVLWTMRVVLAICLAAHIVAALALYSRARRARGAVRAPMRASWSRWMLVSGILIGCFLVVHLLDLTIGFLVAAESFRSGSAHANLVASLSRPFMGWFYTGIMLLAAGHLLHGVLLAATDLGTSSERWRRFFTVLAGCAAILVVLGNAVIPVLVMAGVIR